MKTLFLICLITFILFAGGLGILDLVFSLLGGLIGLVVGLFGLVVGLIGGIIGVVVGSIAIVFTVLLPLLILGAIVVGFFKLVS